MMRCVPLWSVSLDGGDQEGLHLLDPTAVHLVRGPSGVLRLLTESVGYLQVSCYRAFPLSDAEHWIVFFDGGGAEIGMLEDGHGLDPESQALLHEELELRYVVPRVREVLAVREDSVENRWRPALVWDVDTDRGPLRLHLPNLNDHVRLLGPGRILFTDREGRRVVFEQWQTMSPHSRRLIEQHLWVDTSLGG